MPRRDTRSGKTCHAIYPARDHRPLLEKDKKEAIVRFRRERITISPAPNSGNFLPRPKTENPAIGGAKVFMRRGPACPHPRNGDPPRGGDRGPREDGDRPLTAWLVGLIIN